MSTIDEWGALHVASQAVKTIKVPDDIEFRVITNALGLMIASGGLMAGAMVRERSFEFWLYDIVPLLFSCFLAYRLYRTFLTLMMSSESDFGAQQRVRTSEQLRSESAAVARISAKTGFTEQQVLEEVAKRIETKKTEAMKNNKFTN